MFPLLLLFIFFRSIRVLFRMSIEFTRDVEIGIQHVVAHFTSHPQLVSRAHEFDIEILIQQLDLAVEEFNKRGSNFVFDHVTDCTLVITQYRPLSGTSYIPTPSRIANKHAVINVQNRDDRCFQWAVLSCLYPAENNPHRVSNYEQYQDTLNFNNPNSNSRIRISA